MPGVGSAPLRIAVVGAGNMGANHARVLSAMKGVELVGIVDPDRGKAKTLAHRHDCTAYGDPSELIGICEAVTIASSSTSHADVGTFLLGQGLPCMVEKPLATTEADCAALIAAAAAKGVPLAVGHIERFNPAVTKLKELLAEQTVYAIDGRRLNPGSARILDTDVVIDLMVHDIDTVLYAMGRSPSDIVARGIARRKAGVADHVTALLGFDGAGRGPAQAALTASRITQNKVRELQIVCDLGMITIDYITQELHIMRSEGYDRGPGEWPVQGSSALGLAVEKVFIRHAEPLAVELGAFVGWVRRGAPDPDLPPPVTAPEALAALRVVWDIQSQLAARFGH